MKIKMEVDLVPMTVPNYVIAVTPPGKRQDGFAEGPKYKLSELSEQVLSQLCNEFRAEIFKKAGKDDPDKEKLCFQ